MKNRKLVIGASLIFIGLAGMLITHLIFFYSSDGRGMHYRGRVKSNSAKEGRWIYFYGINGRGERIPYELEGRPTADSSRNSQMMRRRNSRHHMMREGFGCVECHRRDGTGGRKLNGDTSADIRWRELEKEDFNFEKFKNVVNEGRENGEEISEVMPRYNMTNSELDSLIKYLKTL